MRISVTTHAAARYRERVKPHLDLDEARRELLRLTVEAPAPTSSRPGQVEDERGSHYTEIAPGIWLALTQEGPERFLATTCLTNSGFSEATRERRNRGKAARRARRKKNREGARFTHEWGHSNPLKEIT